MERRTKYFTLEEMCRSNTASIKGIENLPSEEIKEKLFYLMTHCLDPIREIWGKPIIVNSGYRCPELNKAIGGAKNSQHLKGEAADITTGSKEGNRKLFLMIDRLDIDYDQMIDESDYAWIHISCKKQGNRREIKHL